ncbi:MAG: hypothetical protein ACTHJQ_25870 [Rhizobiaceae bacterium]
MAYASSNFKLMNGGLSGIGELNVWLLDTVDAITDVNTSGYVSDGYRKGARKGDLVYVRIWDTIGTGTVSAFYLCWVIGATSPAIDLTDGLAITATNTD